ncbi:DUF2059 domain-containing protein [Edaphobacter flagellatus]|uniref:DUF2059 domain-containing protein n=1 Tax=Edaphobacter flagellatus TaxID=1933044 RepID=UPI0021B373BC|nr:DUF2059 domain-containing protein [Edaphobacter flagellatus]
MKRIAFTLLLALALPAAAHADDASKRAKAEELVRITKMDQLMDKVMGQMSDRMKAMTAQQTAQIQATPEQQKLIDDFQAKVQQIIQGAISWDKLKPVILQVYSETYTDDELDGIISFYHSPAGQALIAKSPELMTRTMDLMQKQMVTIQPQIQQAAEDFGRKMKATGPAPSSSTAPNSSQKP